MTEKQWRKRTMRNAMVMVPLGVAVMGAGAFLATGPKGMTGYLVGSVGVVLVVLGALLAKFAAWGPVPDRVRGVR